MTQMQTNQVQEAGQNPNAGGNTSLMRITIGPSALASKMIYQMLAMYMQILKSQSEQKNDFYQAQFKETKNQAKATMDSGWRQAGSLIATGLSMVFGSLASAAVTNLYDKGEYAKTKTEMDTIKAPAIKLKEVSSMQPEAAHIGGGAKTVNGKTIDPKAIETRVTQLKNGEFIDKSNSYDEEVTSAAMARIKGEDGVNKTRDFEAMKQKLNTEIASRAQEMNTLSQKLQEITIARSTYSDVVKQAVQALGQGAQAGCTVAKAAADRDVELNRTAGSQAGQGASEMGQDMGKQYQNAMQALQALAAIRQSAETGNM